MTTYPLTDTDCRQCGGPMPASAPIRGSSPIDRIPMRTTGYRCPTCNHWNDLKRRKPRKKKEAAV